MPWLKPSDVANQASLSSAQMPSTKLLASAVDMARRDGVARAPTGAALPVCNPAGDVLAALAISAANLSPASDTLWRDVRNALESEIAATPAAFDSPFANIPPDEIVIDLERVEEGQD